MTQEVFAENIRNWAEARNLLSLDSIDKQGMYLIAEIGEAVSEYLKGNMPAMMLELGDVLVVLQVMRLQAGIECPEEPTGDKTSYRTVPWLLRSINRFALESVDITDNYPFFANHYSPQIRVEEKTRLMLGLRWVHLDTCQALHEIGYTPAQARQAVWGKIANRTGKTVDGVFIKD